jgi:DNA gyrase/topoisomerase IV subunit B
MKKLILVIAFITSLSVLANAQQKASKTPAQKAAHKTQALQKKLNLTAAQTKQVNAIFLTAATRADSLKAHKGDKKANKAAHKTIETQTDQKLNAVFNADQKKAYATIKEAKKEKHARNKAAAAATAAPKQ